MTVATWAQTNFNTQTPTAYRSNIDADMAVAAPIVDNFAPHAVGTPNMTVQLDAGAIPGVGAMPVQVALQTSATLTAPVSNPRNDIVYIDAATGVIGVATGTEAASPVDPAVPAGKIAVARLAMTVGMASITNSIITDLRAPAMTASSGTTFTAISSNTTLTIGQSGGRFKLTGVGTAVTLPTPSGNANVGFLLWGGDSNTQTISPAAATFKMPDGTTPTSYSVTANQGIEVVSDGSVYQVVRMVGKEVGSAITANNITGGAVGSVPYQSGAGATAMLAAGTNGQVLTLAAGVPSWAAAPFSTSYTSATPTALTGVAQVIAENHGLGANPSLIQTSWRCLTAEAGFSIGDEIKVYSIDSPGYYSYTSWANSTQIGFSAGGGTIRYENKTTGAVTALTPANWGVVLRAWK